jgi:VIT1/CCC1 family predicted Fe2+/Mn2+ transporter
MAIYNNNNAMRAVTSRFSLSDYMALLAEAERTGSNPSQLLRQAWQVYQEQQQLDERLTQFESRLTRRTFEIVSAVAGLTETERKQAQAQVKQQLREGV